MLTNKYCKLELFINLQIVSDCFICDDCSSKLKSAHSFKLQCIQVYKKNYPQEQMTVVHYEISDPLTSDQNIDREDVQIEEFDHKSPRENEEHYTVAETDQQNVNDLESIYLEFEDDASDTAIDNVKPKKINPVSKSQSQISPTVKSGTVKRKYYSAEQKLEILELAERCGNREAARRYKLNESSVRCFRRQKHELVKLQKEGKSTNRHAAPHWPKLEKELEKWVEMQKAKCSSSKLKIKEIREEAQKIAKRQKIPNFNGSNSYIFKFMQRHQIPSASPKPRRIKLESEDN